MLHTSLSTTIVVGHNTNGSVHYTWLFPRSVDEVYVVCGLRYHCRMVPMHLSATLLYTYAGTLEHAFGGGHGVDVFLRLLTNNLRIFGDTIVGPRCHRYLEASPHTSVSSTLRLHGAPGICPL